MYDDLAEIHDRLPVHLQRYPLQGPQLDALRAPDACFVTCAPAARKLDRWRDVAAPAFAELVRERIRILEDVQ